MANKKISEATPLTGTGLVSLPAALAGSTTDFRVVHNFTASADPTVNDDVTAGYHAGSIWQRTNGSRWMCRDATDGAAVWDAMLASAPSSVLHNLTATSAPTVNDDTGDGYQAGSMWFRTDLGHLYVCRSATAAAAHWVRVFGDDRVAGAWYAQPGLIPVTGAAHGIDTIRLTPLIRLRSRVTISDIAARVTANQASQNVQFAIYAHNKATNRPTGNALSSTGNISVAATGNVSGALGANVQLEPSDGVAAWLASNCSHATPGFMTGSAAFTEIMAAFIGSATLATVFNTSTGFMSGLTVAQTFNTWPDLTSASFTEVNASNTFPLLAFKVTSVP